MSTSNCGLVAVYDAMISASFVSPTITASDNQQHKFQISVEYPNPCNPLICTAVVFSTYDPLKDVAPKNFSIYINNTWG